MELVVGTCGFQKARSKHYSHLDGVEVQQTFYDPPEPETLSRWRSEAPSSFVFTVKAWMLVTHEYNAKLWRRIRRKIEVSPERIGRFRLTREVLWAWEVTLEAARALRAEAIIVQTPASFGPGEESVRAVKKFFSEAPRDGFQVYWEPRGAWWTEPGLLARVAEESGLMIAGDPLRGRLPPEGQPALYARLHGIGGGEVNYRYRYSDEDLARLRGIVEGRNWAKAYIMFNNVHAFEDAVRFKSLIQA